MPIEGKQTGYDKQNIKNRSKVRRPFHTTINIRRRVSFGDLKSPTPEDVRLVIRTCVDSSPLGFQTLSIPAPSFEV
jgi:hypothetical protein